MTEASKIDAEGARPAHGGIAAALAAAQAEMGKALKQSNNPHFRSKYADLGNVADACLPALNRHGIAVIQPIGEDDGGRYVETRLIHASGESLSCRAPLIVQKNDMQGLGSAITYARRYGLMCMAGIAPEDDDGNAAAAAAPRRDERPAQRPRDDDRRPAADANPVQIAIDSLNAAETLDALAAIWGDLPKGAKGNPAVAEAKDRRKAELSERTVTEDEIPY